MTPEKENRQPGVSISEEAKKNWFDIDLSAKFRFLHPIVGNPNTGKTNPTWFTGMNGRVDRFYIDHSAPPPNKEEVKFHKRNLEPLSYPVGLHMHKNNPAIKQMARTFFETAKSDLDNAAIINLVCRGSSGAIIAAIMYDELVRCGVYVNMQIVHIKKPGERSHTSDTAGLSFDGTGNKHILNVFVDDHLETGSTYNETLEKCRTMYHDFVFDWLVVTDISRRSTLETILHMKTTKNIISNMR